MRFKNSEYVSDFSNIRKASWVEILFSEQFTIWTCIVRNTTAVLVSLGKAIRVVSYYPDAAENILSWVIDLFKVYTIICCSARLELHQAFAVTLLV